MIYLFYFSKSYHWLECVLYLKKMNYVFSNKIGLSSLIFQSSRPKFSIFSTQVAYSSLFFQLRRAGIVLYLKKKVLYFLAQNRPEFSILEFSTKKKVYLATQGQKDQFWAIQGFHGIYCLIIPNHFYHTLT